jgi:xylulose-5-phosphate/fructose-6-phosphate phosphoketolase
MDQASPQHPATAKPWDETLLHRMDMWWRAANYLSVGQIYLLANPLLREKLAHEHVKRRLLGHFGTTPGLNFIWVHLNRLIRARDLNVIFIAGPGHGAPGLLASTWLEGSYTELYPSVTQDSTGILQLFRQFSFPGGVPSHAAPETPGSIHEGGELGYSLSHAFGAAFDNPDLLVACVIGDGEAETGPLATLLAWQQIPQSGNRRGGAADPAPQRLQDRQSNHPGAHRTGRAARFPGRLRMGADFRRRR